MSEHERNADRRYSVKLNPNEEYELRFWSQRFHVSKDALKYAVEKVGTSAEEVEQYLKKHRLRRF